MKIMNAISQKKYFDEPLNQYNQSHILHPTLHTRLELKMIFAGIPAPKKNLLIADFGAGTGRITIPLIRKGYSVWAIDISESSLEKIQQLAADIRGNSLRLERQLPENKKFDFIVGADILHHVSLEKYLPILYNSLKKDGKLIFSEPGALNPAWYLFLPLCNNWQIEKGIMQCRYGHLFKSLIRNKFRKVTITGLGLFPRPLFNLSRLLCLVNDSLGDKPLLKNFAYRYIIEASK